MTAASSRHAVTVSALSGDAALLARLHVEGFGAVVHSVFDRVVNFRPNDVDRLFCLAARQIDDAPDTLVLDLISFGQLQLRPGDTLSSRDRVLRTTALHIDVEGARPWEPALPALPLASGSLAWLRGFLGRARADTSHALGGEDPWLATVTPLVDRHLLGLLEGIRRGDDEATARSASQLVGLGVGLTPSGDDVLVGVTLVANLPDSELGPARHVLAEVIAASAGRTTDISYATLAAAASGRTRESVAGLLRAMASNGSDSELESRGERVAAIGHTSGTDLLTGLSAALDLENELRGD